MDRAWAAALHPSVTMATAILLAALTLAPWAGQAAGRSVAGVAAVALSLSGLAPGCGEVPDH